MILGFVIGIVLIALMFFWLIGEYWHLLRPSTWQMHKAYCLGLIIVNLLEFNEITYSRNKNFYTKNHTKNYAFANMRKALDIALGEEYALRLQTGSQGRYWSTLKAGSGAVSLRALTIIASLGIMTYMVFIEMMI